MTQMLMTRDSLLRAILDDPHDVDLRLVFADFLSDNGQEDRGDFIRVECDIARICEGNRTGKPEPDAERLDSLIARQSELMQNIWETGGWFDPLPKHLISDCVHRRGFVEEVYCSLADWREYGPSLMRSQPLLRVTLSDRKPEKAAPTVWTWWTVNYASERENADDLPKDVFLLLPEGDRNNMRFVDYSSEQLALNALSDALLLWAKQHEDS